MNRLQKKCFIGSAGVHLLLFSILLVGPAFLSSKEKPSLLDAQTLNWIPSITTDALVSSGGNRHAKPPAPAQPAPAPPAQVVPQKEVVEKNPEPETPKQETIEKVDPDAVDLKPQKRRQPNINLKLISRPSDTSKSKTKTADAEKAAQERQAADARRRLGQQFAAAAQNMKAGTATTIEDFGPGDGGPSVGNYADLVRTKYEIAWQAPDDTATDDAITKVSVTIARDGTVLARHITRPSGDAQVDRSVQRTLDRVTFIAPFPEGAKDKQRTYIINFNLRAKRGLA
jgi:TonB family protein